MTSFESIMPILVLVLSLASAAALALALRMELRLAARREISLSNYRLKNSLFYITRDYPVAVIAGAVGVASLVFTVLALVNPVVRVYAIVLALLIAVNGAAVYFSLSRQKFNRDIRIFDAYYVQVEHLLRNKERTQNDITNCRKRVTELHDKLEQTINGFNRNLTQQISAAFLPELFAPVVKMLADYTQEIDRFSGAIEIDFNNALTQFLLDEVQPELRVVPLRTFDDVIADDLIAEIKTSYGAKVAEMVIAQVESGAVAGAKALGNVMTLLHELGVKLDNETLTRFMRAGAVFEDRAELAAMLYANRQISTSVVCDVMVPENWEWAFVGGMAGAFSAKGLTEILVAILANNRPTMCYLFLSQFDASLSSVLEEGLRRSAESAPDSANNEATRQANAFRLILCSDYAVGNAGSVFENLAMMLFDHRQDLPFDEEERAIIEQIQRDHSYMAHRREIGTLYTKATTQAKPLLDSTTRVLLQYVMEPAADGSFLDPKRLVALLGEYRFTLSFAELAVLRMLVGGWILCCSSSEEAKCNVLRELEQLPAPVTYSCKLELANAKEIGCALLSHLAQKERISLRPILYRTETQRVALDRVLALCQKGG